MFFSTSAVAILLTVTTFFSVDGVNESSPTAHLRKLKKNRERSMGVSNQVRDNLDTSKGRDSLYPATLGFKFQERDITAWTRDEPVQRYLIGTTNPLASPTGSPTTDPLTGSPTGSPTPAPTGSPTTSSAPSGSPITDELATANEAFTKPAGNSDATAIEVITPASVKIDGVTCEAGKESTLTTSVQTVLQASSCPPAAGSSCKVKVTKLECESSRRQFRGLQASSLLADFEVILTVYCQTNDCSDANKVVAAVYETVKDTFSAAIADGSFNTALTSSSPTTFVAPSAGAVTFEAVVAPLLEALTDWYPSWHNGKNTCLNDGNAPFYMKNGNFIKSSLENCCNWYYSWDFTNCMILGGASSSAYATNEFYVDYYSDSCKQSCLKETAGLNCGGIAPSWKEVFATASSCCEDTLWWVESTKCVADSDLNPPTLAPGSTPVVVIPEWYRDGEKCVKDCEKTSSDAQCGGSAERWEETFPTSGECCRTKLWWVETKKCT